ncbi:hypothetical protein [Streptosporangium sp. NPDC000396]|uniref:hypothetical protein n=1 Tax=Streptosporangium sp. NPDC000396 TaxID=3366185 RepID=UPI0036C077B8
MTMLTYTVLTDPAPLEASAAGRPSTGTVYLLVTNTGQQAAYWSTTTVTVPIGNGTGDLTLTSNFNKIKTKGEYVPRPGTPPGTRPSVNVQRQGSNAVQATAPGGPIHFRPGDYMVLTLENVTVAAKPGLAVLTVTENAGRTKPEPGSLPPSSMAAVALVKTTPKELPTPRDFRPDKAMVDAGDKLTLHWEEIAGFGYEITYPGAPQPVPVSGGSWSPPAPKRATTYILTATGPNKQQHFLTTTVQVRNPELETLTATTEIKTPRVQGTATNWGLTITGTGAEISNGSGGKGPLTAGRAVFNGVLTEYVEGPNSGEGVITFPQGGVKIWRTGGSDDLGTLYAGKADLTGVNTEWVQGRSTDDGWISFPKEGVNVRQGSGAWGTVFAGKADLTGVNTEWVQGRNNDDGWISFPRYGVQVYQGGTNTHGAVYADSIRAKDAPYGQGGGWINLHDEGITVYLSKDGSNGLGNVTARAYKQ